MCWSATIVRIVIVHRSISPVANRAVSSINSIYLRRAQSDGEKMLSASGVGPETLEDAPEGTKPPVEPLSNPQKAVIEKIAKISFSDMDWAKIDFARYDFTSMSRTKPQAREARQVAMRLKAIVNSLNRATAALRAPRRNGDKISIHRKAMVLIAYELTPDHSVTRLFIISPV